MLCNKLSLDWPGVGIGQSKQQKLILRNNSNAQKIQLSLSILGDHSNFQIQNDYLLLQRGVNKYEASIKPHGELPVHVLFIPSSFSMVSSSLVLRTLSGSTKFVIPLSGYGGCSNLDLNGVRKLNEQLWVDLGDVYVGKKKVVHLTIRNSGSRAGFVAIKCFSGTSITYSFWMRQVNLHTFLLKRTYIFSVQPLCCSDVLLFFENLSCIPSIFIH